MYDREYDASDSIRHIDGWAFADVFWVEVQNSEICSETGLAGWRR